MHFDVMSTRNRYINEIRCGTNAWVRCCKPPNAVCEYKLNRVNEFHYKQALISVREENEIESF